MKKIKWGILGAGVTARETISGYRKDVISRIHGGGARDRKKKLLEK
jgi:GTP-binding protein LepA